jgi:hypothetical protein
MKTKKKPKFPRAFFKVPMSTQVIPPKKGKGSKETSPYSRKAKHKKATVFEKLDAVVLNHFGPASKIWYTFFVQGLVFSCMGCRLYFFESVAVFYEDTQEIRTIL